MKIKQKGAGDGPAGGERGRVFGGGTRHCWSLISLSPPSAEQRRGSRRRSRTRARPSHSPRLFPIPSRAMLAQDELDRSRDMLQLVRCAQGYSYRERWREKKKSPFLLARERERERGDRGGDPGSQENGTPPPLDVHRALDMCNSNMLYATVNSDAFSKQGHCNRCSFPCPPIYLLHPCNRLLIHQGKALVTFILLLVISFSSANVLCCTYFSSLCTGKSTELNSCDYYTAILDSWPHGQEKGKGEIPYSYS
jgi:hypothetical protein